MVAPVWYVRRRLRQRRAQDSARDVELGGRCLPARPTVRHLSLRPRVPLSTSSSLRMIRNMVSTVGYGVVLAFTSGAASYATAQQPRDAGPTPLANLAAHAVVPRPTSVVPGSGAAFALTASTSILVPAGSVEVARIGEGLAFLLRPSTGFAVPVSTGGSARG